MIGKTLGPYAVLDKLGEGAMGQVYRATLSARSTGSTLAIVTNWFEELRRRAPARK